MKRKLSVILVLVMLLGVMLYGCGSSPEDNSSDTANVPDALEEEVSADSTEEAGALEASELTARFGYEGEPFTLHLYENDTAAAIARHVGSSDWNLPIYHYDDFDNWEVMQYYDIPDSYEIPSVPEEIEEEKAGEVYYSGPNRIILFYQDAEVPAEYTPVGYFDNTEEFVDAVKNNPVLEGWGNKIINISAGK